MKVSSALYQKYFAHALSCPAPTETPSLEKDALIKRQNDVLQVEKHCWKRREMRELSPWSHSAGLGARHPCCRDGGKGCCPRPASKQLIGTPAFLFIGQEIRSKLSRKFLPVLERNSKDQRRGFLQNLVWK